MARATASGCSAGRWPGGATRSCSSEELDDAVKAVLALALTDVGREREAVSLAIGALAPHLPRYQRSMADYARLLVGDE
jgi:hypothetical protein